MLVGGRSRRMGSGKVLLRYRGATLALQNSSAEWNLIAACDMPGLTGEFLGGLMEAAEGWDGEVPAPAEEARAVTLIVPELAHFQNVNTPGDWARYDAG